jgi:hypothetical protein
MTTNEIIKNGSFYFTTLKPIINTTPNNKKAENCFRRSESELLI